MPSEISVDVELSIIDRPFVAPQQFLKDISFYIQKQTVKRLRSGRTISGTFMRKLAPKTVYDKVRQRSATPKVPLMRTGMMARAIRFRQINKNLFEVYVAPIGSPRRDLLAVIHQYTGANPYARVIRPFLGMTRADREWSIRRFRRWLIEKLAKAKYKKVRVK